MVPRLPPAYRIVGLRLALAPMNRNSDSQWSKMKIKQEEKDAE